MDPKDLNATITVLADYVNYLDVARAFVDNMALPVYAKDAPVDKDKNIIVAFAALAA